MKCLTRNIAATVLSLAMIVIPAMSFAAQPEQEMDEMIGSAKTAADHEALAAKYESEAEKLLGQSERHERMGARYAGIEIGGAKGPKFAAHCKALAEDFRNAAQENRELAALHRELAAAAAD
jgi:hypothetical protein